MQHADKLELFEYSKEIIVFSAIISDSKHNLL